MIDRATRTWRRAKGDTIVLIIFTIMCIMTLLAFAGEANALPCDTIVVYEGKGAGPVVFDGKLHSEKGLTCAECHEAKFLSPALFAMKRGVSDISMRRMELGKSCGYCHEVSMRNTLICDKCHKK